MSHLQTAVRLSLVTSALLLAVPAHAEDEAEAKNPDVEDATKVLKQYLDVVKKAGEGRKPKPADVSKKLQAAKKFIHPKTLEVIADQEKRKTITNGLAVWHWALKDYWMTSYEIAQVKPSVAGTVLAETQEKNWRVEEGGEDADPEPCSYLLAKYKGKWFVVDKRRNESFSEDAIKIGYKGYFDEVKKAEEPKPE